MHHRRLPLALLPLLGSICLSRPLRAQAPTPQLAAVLAQMDDASKKFKTATADFQWEFVEKIANTSDTTRQHGSMYIERTGAEVSFGATVFEEGSGASATSPSTIIDFNHGTALVYKPNDKQADRFKSGTGQSNFGNYLSIGFGGSGHDLAAAWQITDGGPVTLTEDNKPISTEKLILVSKDPGVRDNFKQVTVWVDLTRDVSLKQIFETPSGSERTATYTNIHWNSGKINKKPFDIPTSGTHVVDH